MLRCVGLRASQAIERSGFQGESLGAERVRPVAQVRGVRAPAWAGLSGRSRGRRERGRARRVASSAVCSRERRSGVRVGWLASGSAGVRGMRAVSSRCDLWR